MLKTSSSFLMYKLYIKLFTVIRNTYSLHPTVSKQYNFNILT